MEEAIRLMNEIAPEHLEVATDNPFELLSDIKHAGAIFLGHNTPEAIGDYVAGPNHTLPTGGTAKFYSPLSTENFMKKALSSPSPKKRSTRSAKRALLSPRPKVLRRTNSRFV
jgi:Histidinol dehydrogenase